MNLTPITLVGILACNAYPEDTNLKVSADGYGYEVCGEEGEGTRCIPLGTKKTYGWLYKTERDLKMRITLAQGDEEGRVVFGAYLLDAQRKIVAPSMSYTLEINDIIGADCGFHPPDSHDHCYAAVKVKKPVILTYEVIPFPGERNTEDNKATVTLSLRNLESYADALSSKWITQELREVEEERKELAEKDQGWK